MSNLQGFAEACYDHNSIEELQAALKLRKADITDCDIWNITPSQWRAAIEEALAAKRLDAPAYSGMAYAVISHIRLDKRIPNLTFQVVGNGRRGGRRGPKP